MSNFTLNSVLDSIKADIQDVLSRLSQDELNELTPSDVCDLLDENRYYAPEVIYYADGWEIVAGNSFNDYSADGLDFSGCDNALGCVMHEARMVIDSVYYNEREAIASEVLESLQEVLADDEEEIYSKSESRLNGLYWAETDNGDMLSFKTQDELHTFLNNQ